MSESKGFGADRMIPPTEPMPPVVMPTEIRPEVTPENLSFVNSELDALSTRVYQLESTQTSFNQENIERALGEHVQGILNLDRRLTVVQNATAFYNLRVTALSLAIQAKSITHPNEIVKAAEVFFTFLAGPQAGQQPQQASSDHDIMASFANGSDKVN